MIKQDYTVKEVLIANVFKGAKPQSDFFPTQGFYEIAYDTWLACVEDMAYMLTEDNPDFDQDQFLHVCGVE